MLDGEETEVLGCNTDGVGKMRKIKKNKNKNKRRFSDDQIKSLETMFESESRLEPRKKIEVARELGLQPRQVAIWFQNKRARWKSKQLERDFSMLRTTYNNLASQFENLKKEKQALIMQLERLNELMTRKAGEESKCCSQAESYDNLCESEVKTRAEVGLRLVSEDDSGAVNTDYFGVEQEEPIRLMTSEEKEWGNFESDHLFDHSTSCSSYKWWDFWS